MRRILNGIKRIGHWIYGPIRREIAWNASYNSQMAELKKFKDDCNLIKDSTRKATDDINPLKIK